MQTTDIDNLNQALQKAVQIIKQQEADIKSLQEKLNLCKENQSCSDHMKIIFNLQDQLFSVQTENYKLEQENEVLKEENYGFKDKCINLEQLIDDFHVQKKSKINKEEGLEDLQEEIALMKVDAQHLYSEQQKAKSILQSIISDVNFMYQISFEKIKYYYQLVNKLANELNFLASQSDKQLITQAWIEGFSQEYNQFSSCLVTQRDQILKQIGKIIEYGSKAEDTNQQYAEQEMPNNTNQQH